MIWVICTGFYFLETRKFGSKYKRLLSSVLGSFFLALGVGASMHFYTFDDPVDYDAYLILVSVISSLAMHMVLMYGLTKLAFADQEEDSRSQTYCLVIGSIATIFSLTILISFISSTFIGIQDFVHS